MLTLANLSYKGHKLKKEHVTTVKFDKIKNKIKTWIKNKIYIVNFVNLISDLKFYQILSWNFKFMVIKYI